MPSRTPDTLLPERAAARRVRSEAEAAQHCNISLAHFRRMRRCGQGPPYVRLSERRIGYRPDDLDAWLAERVVAA